MAQIYEAETHLWWKRGDIKEGMIQAAELSREEIKWSNKQVIKKDGFLLKQPGQTQPNKGGKIGWG